MSYYTDVSLKPLSHDLFELKAPHLLIGEQFNQEMVQPLWLVSQYYIQGKQEKKKKQLALRWNRQKVKLKKMQCCFLFFLTTRNISEGLYVFFLLVRFQETERRVLIIKSIYFHILKCKGHNRI